ncbi:transposase [Micromonospora arborensis]|uniref:IS701 family transposase n=1 Tax=Micromonospora arborensis TaxID=2116518 RepID=UPI0033CF0365
MVRELDQIDRDPRLGDVYPNLALNMETMLRRLHGRISGCFARAEPRERALQYLLGLAGGSGVDAAGRRNVASYSREARADGAQRLLTTAQWDDADARRKLREVVRSSVGAAGCLYVVEATFPKKGNAPAGVEHQYRPENGRAQNCQCALFLLHVTPDIRLFMLDLGLYLPPAWITDRDRRARGRIPDGLTYRSKSAIARDLVLSAMDDGFRPDRVYLSLHCRDNPGVLEALQQRQIPHLAGLNLDELGRVARIDAAVPAMRDDARRSGDTAQRGREALPRGPVTVRFPPANSRDGRGASPYYQARAGYPMFTNDVVRSIAERRYVERRWKDIRSEIRMDRYEVRSWRGWYRHMTFAMTVQLANELTSAGPADGELGA